MNDIFKKLFSFGISFGLVFTLIAAAAAQRPDSNSFENPAGKTVSVPENATEVGPGVFDLGTAQDVDGSPVQGYMFVRYKKGFHHRPDHAGGPPGNGGGDDSETSDCYAYLSKDAKWKTIEDWVVNTDNNQGLDGQFVFDKLGEGIANWEDAADDLLVNGTSGSDILGDGSTTDAELIADTDSPDDVNEVYFGDVDSEGAIAVTIVWGRFSGPPFARELVEWDQVYDQVDFDWSSNGDDGKMDFENIADHELGHSVGMGHPSDTCTEETMYAYASEGEIKKRDLNLGDITGVFELY